VNALVFGAEGQLGSELVKLLGAASAVAHAATDVTNSDRVDALIDSRRPEVVFNCAAFNAVDLAESKQELAYRVNAEGPMNLASACRRNGANLVHFSTNFVFDGSLDRPYVEGDEPSPISVYVKSKLAGERLALQHGGHVLIIRSAAVFGGLKSNFPERILERAQAGERLRVVSDQKVNPTFAKDLAGAAYELAGGGTAGIVHVVSEGCCAWDEFARAVLRAAGLDASVESVTGDEFPSAAARPRNGCLATIRFRPLRSWREALVEWAGRRKNP
jgi:dTDP-4-dehydrorhamnose reductase